MKFARRLPPNPTLEQQVGLLKELVVIKHDDFDKNTTGIIVSLLQQGFYWVLLDVPYKTKNGHWSRKRMFKPTNLKLIVD
jgi:hypothetical protein